MQPMASCILDLILISRAPFSHSVTYTLISWACPFSQHYYTWLNYKLKVTLQHFMQTYIELCQHYQGDINGIS